MLLRVLIIALLLPPTLSLEAPYEYAPVVSPISEAGLVFSVYNQNYGSVRFNLSIVGNGLNFADGCGYNAEVYGMDGSFLGSVRAPSELSLETYKVRSWFWDKRVFDGEKWVALKTGTYWVRGVLTLDDQEYRTDTVELRFSRTGYFDPKRPDSHFLRREGIYQIRSGLSLASRGMVVVGVFADLVMMFIRDFTSLKVEWRKNRRVFWVYILLSSIVLWSLKGYTSDIYDLFF